MSKIKEIRPLYCLIVCGVLSFSSVFAEEGKEVIIHTLSSVREKLAQKALEDGSPNAHKVVVGKIPGKIGGEGEKLTTAHIYYVERPLGEVFGEQSLKNREKSFGALGHEERTTPVIGGTLRVSETQRGELMQFEKEHQHEIVVHPVHGDVVFIALNREAGEKLPLSIRDAKFTGYVSGVINVTYKEREIRH